MKNYLVRPGILILAAWNLVSIRAAELPKVQHRFVVIAHRGDHEQAHENTLTAFRHAIQAGADYVEIDVRKTADGQYVLMHDRTVDRMTTGHGPVNELTLEQIRGLKVRDLRRPQIPAETVPTFSEALAACKGRINIYLDFKAGDRATIAKMIRDAGMGRQVLVYDDVSAAEEWHRVGPELPLIVSAPDGIKSTKDLVEFGTREKVQVLDGDWAAYSREQVKAALAAGLVVWPDIQDGEENAKYFEKVLERGFTGVQSDHPEELIKWLEERKLR